MGTMRIIDRSGDTKIIWDADKKDEVEAAKNTFAELTDKGYIAYEVKKDGEPGEIVKRFDKKAEKLILAPPMQGG